MKTTNFKAFLLTMTLILVSPTALANSDYLIVGQKIKVKNIPEYVERVSCMDKGQLPVCSIVSNGVGSGMFGLYVGGEKIIHPNKTDFFDIVEKVADLQAAGQCKGATLRHLLESEDYDVSIKTLYPGEQVRVGMLADPVFCKSVEEKVLNQDQCKIEKNNGVGYKLTFNEFLKLDDAKSLIMIPIKGQRDERLAVIYQRLLPQIGLCDVEQSN